MTITNDERRKVAAKLREARENLDEVPVPNDLRERCFTYLYHITKVIAKIIGRGEIFTSLADLIEPEPERTCNLIPVPYREFTIGYEYKCSVCGCLMTDHDSYCSECGARRVSRC